MINLNNCTKLHFNRLVLYGINFEYPCFRTEDGIVEKIGIARKSCSPLILLQALLLPRSDFPSRSLAFLSLALYAAETTRFALLTLLELTQKLQSTLKLLYDRNIVLIF